FNGGLFAGFFTTADLLAGPAVAFVITEPASAGGPFRGELYLRSSDGTVARSADVPLVVGGRYHFALAYSGAGHDLSGTIAGTAVTTGPLDAGLGDAFDAFGIGTGLESAGGGDDAGQQATAWFDNLAYTDPGSPTPAPTPTPPPPLPAPATLRVMPLGDSITSGAA